MRCSARHLLAERNGHLPDLVRVKGLLQVGELFLRRHHGPDVAPGRCPSRRCTPRSRWRDRARECAPRPTPRRDPAACAYRETPLRMDRPPRCASRTASTAASAPSQNTGAKVVLAPTAARAIRRRAWQTTAPQIVEHGGLAAHVRLGEDLTVRIADLGFVVGDRVLVLALARFSSRASSSGFSCHQRDNKCIEAPSPGPSLAAQILPPKAAIAFAHQCSPMP